ncbi:MULTISPECIES: SDR family oxidoreductase [unclassified Chelatococcus]|uniref:SDR family NAD(P)-dependent oxidoreductase n=1 Tax=unclassified Chelatococcus TaxID=2638111 RepID=UPI001BCB748D|nr:MULTISPECIES: SDR family oxidoreductase [unclassified Chelatococcus]MBS7700618.1 SDR family oxidoreductase [Chelatococcus sp. YT9]MBX3559049.1 SDR family oxidoreductase [Chelatococcus sp.]
MDTGIEGKLALVTGGSQGIGKGIALALAGVGCRVAIVGRDRTALNECLNLPVLRDTGAVACSADLATSAGVERTIQWLRTEVGPAEIIVNNAGGSRPCDIFAGPAVWEESFYLNFAQARLITTEFLPDMLAKGWGRVINITGGTMARAMNASSPAKAALQSWAKSLAFEVAARGVTVNCVAPGRIDSVQVRKVLHPDERLRAEYIAANIAAGHFGEPDDIAAMVVFLASDLAGYITGATIPVDGGQIRLAV